MSTSRTHTEAAHTVHDQGRMLHTCTSLISRLFNRCSCVLDFFVYESVRRTGVGKALFECMCVAQRIPHPALLAYDRPSHMFTAFLARHYGLTAYVPQSNNYVLFDSYWAVLEQHKRGVLQSLWAAGSGTEGLSSSNRVEGQGGPQFGSSEAAQRGPYSAPLALQAPQAVVPTTLSAMPSFTPSGLPSSYPSAQAHATGPYGTTAPLSRHAVPQHLHDSARVLGGGTWQDRSQAVGAWGPGGALPSGRLSLGGTGKRMFRQGGAVPGAQPSPFWTGSKDDSVLAVGRGPSGGPTHVGDGDRNRLGGQEDIGSSLIDQMRHSSTSLAGRGGRLSLGGSSGRYGATPASTGRRPF